MPVHKPQITWDVRDEDVERFTEGDCHIFAHEMHKATGWPMYSMRDAGSAIPDAHCFVLRPDGKAVDVQGVWALRTLLRAYMQPQAMPISWPPHPEFWDEKPCFGAYSRRRARKLVQRITTEGPAMRGLSVV